MGRYLQAWKRDKYLYSCRSKQLKVKNFSNVLQQYYSLNYCSPPIVERSLQFPFCQWFYKDVLKGYLQIFGKQVFNIWLLSHFQCLMGVRSHCVAVNYWYESRLIISFDCQPWMFVSPIYNYWNWHIFLLN